MRVVVDVTPLFNRLTGIGWYWVGMLDGLVQASEGEHEIVAFSVTGPRRRRAVASALDGLAVKRRLVVVPPSAGVWRRLWTRVGRPPVERVAGPLDVFHFSEWMQPRQRGGVRTTTIHDLVPLRFPEWVSPVTRRMHAERDAIAARECDVIVCNSRHTAGDVHEHLGVPEERLRVAYPGLDPALGPDGDGESLGAPYVLSVATDEPRKNLRAAVERSASCARAGRSSSSRSSASPGGATRSSRSPGSCGSATGPISRRSTAGRRRPATRRASRASACRSSSRWRAVRRPSARPIRRSTRRPAAWRCARTPTRRRRSRTAIEQAVARRDELREPGLRHAAQFTRRACGEAVLAAYDSAR